MINRPPLPPPRPIGGGPSPAGKVLAIVAGLLLIVVALLLYPTFRALNGAIVGTIEDWRGLVGGAVLLFLAMLMVAIVLRVFAGAKRAAFKAEQAAVIKLANDMPAHIRDLADGQLIASLLKPSLIAHFEAKIEESKRPFPHLTSFNQHMHNVHPPPQLAAPGAVIDAPPLAIPTFAELLDSGQIGPGRPLILGYRADTGQPILGGWKDLYSCGVGALQGAGKTWLLAFLLSQSAAAGGRLIICDLHAGDEESLANRIGSLAPAFMCDIASTPKEIAQAFAFADDKLEKRKTNGARWPIVLVADEWTSLLRTAAGTLLPTHIQNIAEQGRKFHVNGMLAAQAWTKAASSDVRNQLTSHYVMRQRPEEARYQLGLRAEQLPDDIRSLPDATGYFLSVAGDLTKIVVPRMTAADIARCGELIDTPASSPPPFGFLAPTDRLPLSSAPSSAPAAADISGNSRGTQTELTPAVSSTAAGPRKSLSPEAARAIALFQAGSDIADIIRELRGELSGRARQQASAEIQQLIREGLHL